MRFTRWPAVRLPLSQSARQTQNFNRTVASLAVWIVAATVTLGLCALHYGLDSETKKPWSDALMILCRGGMLSLAFGAVGGLIGFLFGIPRTGRGASTQQGSSQQADRRQSPDATPTAASEQNPNTNLEEVSDWLTKIILGAGLTQLVKVPEKIKGIGEYLQSDFGGSRLLPEAIAIHSLVLGFFIGYLITRLFLAGAFAIADSESALAKISRALRDADAQTDKEDYRGATTTLETAIAAIGPNTPPETILLYYEKLTYTALYEPEPTGFEKAIDYFSRYVRVVGKPPSARLYVNVACAYGQQYLWESKNENRPEVLHEIRGKALDAVRDAIQLDPGTKAILQLVWNPEASKMRDEENDLEVFYGDAEFKVLLK